MVKVGIDALAIYTPRYVISHETLACARGIDADKFHIGLGQYEMSVAPPGEDVVTMAANAAREVLRDIDLQSIEMVLFATESGIDQSKAAGIFVHGLLNLPTHCRVVELKQACYSGTAAIQLALPYLRENQHKKILVIASDIARYGLNTPGESSQGAGAVAMILSANPRILAIEAEYGVATEDVMDFWRPNYSHEAFVDGKYSSKLYLQMLEKSWLRYREASQRAFSDHDYFCYHTPVPRLVEKAHQHLLKLNQQVTTDSEKQVAQSLEYGRKLGNSYSASLYIALASLLDHARDDLSGKRIGFYSYGSGCVAEYFSGIVQAGYRDALRSSLHHELIKSRSVLSYQEYEAFFGFEYNALGEDQAIPEYETGFYRLAKMQQHKRVYEVCAQVDHRDVLLMDPRLRGDDNISSSTTVIPAQAGIHHDSLSPADNIHTESSSIKVCVPGKLILSGEHAVVYGQPAIAMAVNRYVTATVTHESVPTVLFDLSDLSHHSHFSFDALRQLKRRIKQKYYGFVRGDYRIRDVLQKPFELAQFAMGLLAESLNLTLPHGVKIQVQSELPIGCGMGSSAATILSVMQAIANYLHLPISQEKLFELALEAEHMQHGHSSGLDLRIAMHGGCLYVHGDQLQSRALPTAPLYLVNTGAPHSTTGQCVEHAAAHFKSQGLQSDFAAVTNAFDAALIAQSADQMQSAIRENHRLLTRIGVVPNRVQQFIASIEATNAAAKICGAGSVRGDNAGAVIVLSHDESAVTQLSKRFDYQVIPIAGAVRGIHAA